MYSGAVITFLAGVCKTPIGKWFIKAIKRDARDLMLSASSEANAELEERVKQLQHITNYHLGPNSGATPVHMRIERLENVKGIES